MSLFADVLNITDSFDVNRFIHQFKIKFPALVWPKKSQHFPRLTNQHVFFRKQIKPEEKNNYTNKSQSTFMNSFCYRENMKGFLQIQLVLTQNFVSHFFNFCSRITPHGGLHIIQIGDYCSQCLDRISHKFLSQGNSTVLLQVMRQDRYFVCTRA